MQVLEELIRSKLPALGVHLARIGVDISMLATDYFLCLFCTVMPSETAMRIWDALLLEGPKVLYRTALTLLKVSNTWPALLPQPPAHSIEPPHSPIPVCGFKAHSSSISPLPPFLRTPAERALVGRQENQAALLALDDAGSVLQHTRKAAAGAHDRDGLMDVRHPVSGTLLSGSPLSAARSCLDSCCGEGKSTD